MLSRRSIFSLFAGAIAALTGAKAVASTPEANVAWIEREMQSELERLLRDPKPLRGPRVWIDTTNYELEEGLRQMAVDNEGRMVPLPRRRPYVCTAQQYEAGECLPTEESLGMMFPRGMLVTGAGLPDSISAGDGRIVAVDSPEGREILESMAAPNAGKSRW